MLTSESDTKTCAVVIADGKSEENRVLAGAPT